MYTLAQHKLNVNTMTALQWNKVLKIEMESCCIYSGCCSWPVLFVWKNKELWDCNKWWRLLLYCHVSLTWRSDLKSFTFMKVLCCTSSNMYSIFYCRYPLHLYLWPMVGVLWALVQMKSPPNLFTWSSTFDFCSSQIIVVFYKIVSIIWLWEKVLPYTDFSQVSQCVCSYMFINLISFVLAHVINKSIIGNGSDVTTWAAAANVWV